MARRRTSPTLDEIIAEGPLRQLSDEECAEVEQQLIAKIESWPEHLRATWGSGITNLILDPLFNGIVRVSRTREGGAYRAKYTSPHEVGAALYNDHGFSRMRYATNRELYIDVSPLKRMPQLRTLCSLLNDPT